MQPIDEDIIVPPKSEREYYRHAETGDRGYLVKSSKGVEYVRYDRGSGGRNRTGFADKRFTDAEKNSWVPDSEHRPLTRFQVAHIAFEADRALCSAIGLHAQARNEWLSMTTPSRLKWADQGPTVNPTRAKLWRAIMAAVGDLASREG